MKLPASSRTSPLLALLLAALLGLAGCTLVGGPVTKDMKAVSAQYATVRKGMSRAEVEAALGQPASHQEDGTVVWEKRYDDVNVVRLEVWFDKDDRVERRAITREHGSDGAMRTRSSVSLDR